MLSPRCAFNGQSYLELSPEQNRHRSHILDSIDSGRYRLEEVTCLCGASEDHQIASRDRYGLPVDTWLCGACGLMRSSPRLDAASSELFYTEVYRPLYTPVDYGVQELFQKQIRRSRKVTEMLAQILPTVETVFEVGCGPGGNLAAFAEHGKQVAGVDLGNNAELAWGRSLGLDLLPGDAESLLAERGQADLVVCIHVAEHFSDLLREIRSLTKLIRPGGWLHIEVPGVRSIPECYRGDLMLYLQNAHNYHFTAKTMSMVLAACGLHVAYASESVMCLAVPAEEVGSDEEVNTLVADPEEGRQLLAYLQQLEAELQPPAAASA